MFVANKGFMKAAKSVRVGLVIVLALILVFAMPATSYSLEQRQTITYSYLSDANQPDIPTSVKTDDNGVWQLTGTSEPKINSNYEHPYQDYEQTISAVVKAGASYKHLFEQTIAVNEGYMEGKITLDGFNVTPGYSSNVAQVERVHIFKNVSNQELDEIPETYEFKVKSDSAPQATAMVALTLSESDYKITKYDEAGMPLKYTVTADYRGQESYLSHTYDNVYASYKGRVLDTRDQLIIDATYEYQPNALAAVIAEGPTPLTQHVTSPLVALAATAGIIIVLAAWGLLLLLLLRKNARLVMTNAPDFYSDTNVGKTIKRRYAKVVAGEAYFIIPDNVNLFEQNHNYSIALSAGLASKGGVLNIIWRNRIVIRAELQSAIDLRVSQAVYATAKLIENDILTVAQLQPG